MMGLKEYTGMPIFSEVGPLVIDPEIEKVAYENFEKKVMNFSIKIESANTNENSIVFPCDGLLEINDNLLKIFIENEGKTELFKGKIGSDIYPFVVLLKKSNNIFEINFSEAEKIKCCTKSNKERDIIALSIRLLSGKHINESEIIEENSEEFIEENHDKFYDNDKSDKNNDKSDKNNDKSDKNDKNHEKSDKNCDNCENFVKIKREKFELYLKLEQLTKDVLRLTKEKENTKLETRNLGDSLIFSRKELLETKERLENCTKNYYELLEENKTLKNTLEIYMNEKLFLFQVFRFYAKNP